MVDNCFSDICNLLEAYLAAATNDPGSLFVPFQRVFCKGSVAFSVLWDEDVVRVVPLMTDVWINYNFTLVLINYLSFFNQSRDMLRRRTVDANCQYLIMLIFLIDNFNGLAEYFTTVEMYSILARTSNKSFDIWELFENCHQCFNFH